MYGSWGHCNLWNLIDVFREVTARMCIQLNPTIPDTLGREGTVLIIKIDALISGVEDVLWESMESHLVPVASVHSREISAIQDVD